MPITLVIDRHHQLRAEESAAFGAIAERFRRAGDPARAAALCRDGLLRFPDHMSARVTLGWALIDLGHLSEARQALETVLRRAPDNLAAIRGLARLHDHHDQMDHESPARDADLEATAADLASAHFALEDVWPPEELEASSEDVQLAPTCSPTAARALESWLAAIELRRQQVLSEWMPAAPPA